MQGKRLIMKEKEEARLNELKKIDREFYAKVRG